MGPCKLARNQGLCTKIIVITGTNKLRIIRVTGLVTFDIRYYIVSI